MAFPRILWSTRNKIVSFAFLISVFTETGGATPCWERDLGAYSNGKCFVLVKRSTTWNTAKKFCESNYDRLAEPRTRESVDLLMTNDKFSRFYAWVGATRTLGSETRHVSDRTRFYYYRYWPRPADPLCSRRPCCIRSTGASLWTNSECSGKYYFFCERDVRESYILPIPPLGTNARPRTHQATFEILAMTSNLIVTVNMTSHTSTGSELLTSLDLSDANPVAWYDLAEDDMNVNGSGGSSGHSMLITCLPYLPGPEFFQHCVQVRVQNGEHGARRNTPQGYDVVCITHQNKSSRESCSGRYLYIPPCYGIETSLPMVPCCQNEKSGVLCEVVAVATRRLAIVTQSNCVQILTSHPVSLTFYVEDNDQIDFIYLMTPEVTPWVAAKSQYLIVSPSDNDTVNQVIVTSLGSYETTEVTIEFTEAGSKINVGGLEIRNPEAIQVSLTPFQSIILQGQLDMEGVQIKGSHEVCVHVIMSGNSTQNESTAQPKMYPLIEEDIASSEYVTFPSDVTGHYVKRMDIYTVASIHENTKITINGNETYLESIGETAILEMVNDRYHYLKGNKPFQIYRLYSQSLNDLCWTPLTPSSLFRKDYSMGYTMHWIRNTDIISIHIILETDSQSGFTINGASVLLECSAVEGNTIMSGCTVDVKGFLVENDQEGSVLNLKLPGKFAAYLSWRKEGILFCKRLGVKWIDVELELWVEPMSPLNASSVTTVFTSNTTSALSSLMNASDGSPSPNAVSTDSNLNTIHFFSLTVGMNTQAITKTGLDLPETTLSTPTEATTLDVANERNKTEPPCVQPKTLPTNLTIEEVDGLVAAILKNLSVSVKMTSSYVRKKTSAKDERPSSQSLGYVGIVFIVIVFGSLITADILKSINFLLQVI